MNNQPMTDQELNEIQARWDMLEPVDFKFAKEAILDMYLDDLTRLAIGYADHLISARSEIPRLVEEVRRLRGEIAKLKGCTE